ncbi:MAG: hypothetical protein VYC39_03875 [Myxococcota bacterium]|nr:hypothetical protein [Myxococcota bacterium]
MSWSYPKRVIYGVTLGLMVASGCKCSCTSKKPNESVRSKPGLEPTNTERKRSAAPKAERAKVVTRTSTNSRETKIDSKTGEMIPPPIEQNNLPEGVTEVMAQIPEAPTSTLAGENSGGTQNAADGSDGGVDGIIMVEEGFGLPADKAAEYLEEKEKVLQANRSLAGDAGVMLPPQQDSGVHPWLIPVEPKTVKRYGIEVERYAPTKVIRR